jgi:hypothetical protein
MSIGDSRVDSHYSSSYDAIAGAIDRSPIPFLSDLADAKRHLLKRLLLAMLTGNGDMHLENLSILDDGTRRAFSPVYDPTPMRAYSIHNALCAMPFGDSIPGSTSATGRWVTPTLWSVSANGWATHPRNSGRSRQTCCPSAMATVNA